MSKIQLTDKYQSQQSEEKWYKEWMENNLFSSTPDERTPYTIVIPPPNVTGVLHMGHMLNNTLQDVLLRRARMSGFNALWVPGTDHASIATEAKVVGKLREEGIKKSDLSRDEFLGHCWDWTHKHGGIILEQLKSLGASCDWDRTKFTMDEDMYESVIKTFVKLHKQGFIYRDYRMVHWDPKALTALSDEEVIHKEEQSKLYYVKYQVEGENDFVTIATTRPETILGDSAVCINPDDERFTHLKGKRVIVPLVNRSVPIIEDDYVDIEFGTGCLKITPAHDENDYEIGKRHKLETIGILNADGTMSEEAQFYIGKDRFEARKLILEDLKKEGSFVKSEEYTNKVGYSERTDAVIEPRLSLQWFMKMEDISKEALEVVENDTVRFFPKKFKNTYRHWMENVRDWCVSRQLWWGHRIPAYFLDEERFVVAESLEEAFELAKEKYNLPNLKIEELKQDEDVLDTWFSSWLWPITVFDGVRNPDNKDINYYYPTDVLVTAPEILFFWVARMIIAGLDYRKDIPFKDVYLTGIVRDKLGRKMSKSLGNSPDPIELMGKYGADGVRVGMLLTSPAGNDLPFDEGLCEQGRNFSNKIWNALRLVKGWEVDNNLETPEYAKVADKWFEAKLNETIALLDDHYSKYRISDALMTLYKLIWDDFSSWYLEMIKPAYQTPIDKETLEKTLEYFEKLMKLLHPFMPFITEEVYHSLKERAEGDYIMISDMPRSQEYDQAILKDFEQESQVINGIRRVRKEKNIAFKETVRFLVKRKDGGSEAGSFDSLIAKLGNLESIEYITEKVDLAAGFIVKSTEYFIPMEDSINVEEEILKVEEELKYNQGFLKSVNKKLSNERFVNNAPAAVVDKEKQKKADAENKVQVLEERLVVLRKM
jgi:valyl-tRNA synthetase